MLEIERKFLVSETDLEKLGDWEGYPHEPIVQGYLSFGGDGGPEVRIRKIGDKCLLTEKSGEGMVREERESPLSPEEFERKRASLLGSPIEKTRYFIPLENGLTAELDIFGGALTGLRVAEVEFPSREIARAFRAPAWFGPEVTGDSRYRNKNLAQSGLRGLL